MTALTLKSYQQAALDSLTAFARLAQLKGPALAFGELAGRPYTCEPFGQVPCVCLGIPTGGGKTLMAAHAVALLAREWRASDAPVVVWLVPSDAIRSQTLKALQSAGHPYREALEAAYGAQVRVCELEDLAHIAPCDWGQRGVVVATIQSFRIADTDKRNVYSFSERFERHFKGCDEQRLRVLHGLPDAVVTETEAATEAKGGILKGFVGQPRWSLFESNQPPAPVEPAQVTTNFIAVAASPELVAMAGVSLVQIAGETQVLVSGHIGAELEILLLAQVHGAKKQEQVREKVAQHNALAAAQAAPASRGVPFAPVPTLGYPALADLKDGGEEFACAQLLDHHAAVKHWVRNLDTAPCGFALATSRGRFFPDFVAELMDGRIAVVEYKGAHLLNDPYEMEKRQIGELWARTSDGACVFGQIVKDRAGADMATQLDAMLA